MQARQLRRHPAGLPRAQAALGGLPGAVAGQQGSAGDRAAQAAPAAGAGARLCWLIACCDSTQSCIHPQTLMPPEHLASQAPRGSTPLQQLGALQSLHARIRRGKLKPSSDVPVFEATLGLREGSRLVPKAAQLSPDRQRIVVPWLWEDTEAGGALVVGADWKPPAIAPASKAPDTTPRPFTRLQPLHAAPTLGCLVAHSPCSRFCASLTLREAPDGRHAFLAHVFRVRTQQWQPERLLHSGAEECSAALPGSGLQLSQGGDPVLAAALVESGGQAVLLVFGVSQPGPSLVVDAPGATSFLWLPRRAHAVVLLRPGSVARLELHPLPAGPVELGCVEAASEASESCRPCMTLATGNSTLWVAHASEDKAIVSLSAFDAAGLSVLSSCKRNVVAKACSLRASRQALAVSCGAGGTCVFAVSGSLVGEQLYCVEALSSACFSADGRFLSGINSVTDFGVIEDWLVVLDARSGESLMRRQMASFFLPRHIFVRLRMWEAAWGADNPGVLYVKGSAKTTMEGFQNISGVVFFALRFQSAE